MDENEQIRKEMSKRVREALNYVLKKLENGPNQPGLQKYIKEWNQYLRRVWEIAYPPQIDPSTGQLVRTDPAILFPTRLVSRVKRLRDREALKKAAQVEENTGQQAEASCTTVNNDKVPGLNLEDVYDDYGGLPPIPPQPEIFFQTVSMEKASTKEKAVNMEKAVSPGKPVTMGKPVIMEKVINMGKAFNMRNARKKRSKKTARVDGKAAEHVKTNYNGVSHDHAPAIKLEYVDDDSDEPPKISRHSYTPIQSANIKNTIKMGKAVNMEMAVNKENEVTKEKKVAKETVVAKENVDAKEQPVGYEKAVAKVAKEKSVINMKPVANTKVVSNKKAMAYNKAAAKKNAMVKENADAKAKGVDNEKAVNKEKAVKDTVNPKLTAQEYEEVEGHAETSADTVKSSNDPAPAIKFENIDNTPDEETSLSKQQIPISSDCKVQKALSATPKKKIAVAAQVPKPENSVKESPNLAAKKDLSHGYKSDDKRHGPYYCICENQYKTINSLKIHIYNMNKERKFQCDFCASRFPYQSHLNNHLKNFHKNKKCGEVKTQAAIKVDQPRCSK